MLASLFNLDLKSNDNPLGTLSIADLYKHLLNVRIWGFNNNDTGMAWRRRAWASEGAAVLTKTTKAMIDAIPNNGNKWGLLGWVLGWKTRDRQAKEGSLGWYGRQVAKELMEAGKTSAETADICWLTALAGVGVPVGVVSFLVPSFRLHVAPLKPPCSADARDRTSSPR
jgi:hypothetical protein